MTNTESPPDRVVRVRWRDRLVGALYAVTYLPALLTGVLTVGAYSPGYSGPPPAVFLLVTVFWFFTVMIVDDVVA